MSLFPVWGDSLPEGPRALPLYREVAAHPETGLPVWRGGRPVVAEGREALRLWIAAALQTVRCRHGIFSRDYGCELERLVGRTCSPEVRTAEAPRMLRDALLVNPYITDVTYITVDMEEDRAVISATVQTVYGEVDVHADQIL